MKKIALSAAICTTLALSVLLTATAALAATEFMGGKLILNGYLKNTTYIRTSHYAREKHGPGSNHNSAIDFSNWSFLCEALYTVTEKDDLTVRLFGGFKYWYEMAPKLDDDLRRSIAHRQRKDYIRPRHIDNDMISEAYIDIIKGPWQVRIGKQIVIWGQLDINRVADVVNPLDLRWGVPGVDNWEEIKRGIWMIRTFYQSQLPGNLLFEFIFNPGDYRGMYIPYTGTHWGPEYFKNATFSPGKEMGLFSWMQEKWYRDHPGWNLKKNYEWGFRIRGFTWNIDWTLLFWDALDDGPVADADRVGPFVFQYIQAGIAAGGGRVHPGDWPDKKIYKYKRYQTVGGTAQTYVDWLYQSVWRLEWFYEINRPMNLGTDGSSSAVYDEYRANILGIAIQGNWKLDIPWFTRNIGTGKQMDFSLTYFWEKIFQHERDMLTADRFHRPGDSVTDAVTMFIKQEMFNTSWVFIFIGNYYFRAGKWMAVPSFTYVFPESVLKGGLRMDIGAKLYGGAKHGLNKPSGLSHLMDHKDSIIFRIRYEF